MKFKSGIIILICFTMLVYGQRNVDVSKKLNKDGEITVSIISGDITVKTWDKNEVHIQGTLGKDVKELVVKGNENRLRIESELVDKKGNTEAEVNLTIIVPERAELDINTVSAPIEVSGLKSGECELKTVSGDVHYQGDVTYCELSSVSGKVVFDGKGKKMKAKSVSGNVMGEGSYSEIHAASVSGNVSIENLKAEEMKLTSTSGRVTYKGGLTDNAEFKANSVSGSVVVDFDDDVEGEFKISTLSGDIDNELTDDKPVKKEYGPGASLSFTKGKKDNEIKISTVSGDIRLK